MWRWSLWFSLFLISSVHATELTKLNQWIVLAQQQHLADNIAWLHLGHYRPNLLSQGYSSFADGINFFLATDGKTNPQAELAATITAIASPPIPGQEDAHAQCRFIARFHWLKEQLAIADNAIPHVHCSAYQEWYQQIHPSRVTLVFPSAYINNPSSMFGHTLLRIDPPPSQTTTALISYSISYAAETTEFNGMAFAINGLFGGYAGYFSVQPYYDKVNEYKDLENRDIWEYELNLTTEEVTRLLEHAWELHNTAFDYYFLDENCSFQLLTLLDVARPGMNLAAHFPLEVIPVDTLRVVLEQKDILHAVHYRPSSRTNLSYWINDLPASQQDWLLDYTNNRATLADARLSDLPVRERARLFDISYEYVQYQYRRRLLARTDSAPKSLELLTQRSKLSDTQPPADAPAPTTRPDEGHLSSRIATGIGTVAHTDFFQFTWRPAYHDLLDADPGHVAGSQINFMELILRASHQPDNVLLQKFTLIDVFSITPTNRFFSALSWHFDTGLERLPIDPVTTQTHLAYTINGGAGYTHAFTPQWRVYGMLDGSALIHNTFTNNLAAGAGARVGTLWQVNPLWKIQLEGRVMDYRYHADRVLQDLQLTQSVLLDKNNALRLSWQRSGIQGQLETELLLNWHHYYQ